MRMEHSKQREKTTANIRRAKITLIVFSQIVLFIKYVIHSAPDDGAAITKE
jgi:hypothetical protein